MPNSKRTDLTPLLLIGAVILILLSGRDPSPGPGPRPDVDPAPFPSDSLAVLIVEETEARRALPAEQINILASAALREFVQDAGGEIRVWDQDVDAQFLAEKWRQALRKPRDSLPWILIAHEKRGYSGPLPATVDETQALIERFQ